MAALIIGVITAIAVMANYISHRHNRHRLDCDLVAISKVLQEHALSREIARWHGEFLLSIIEGTLSPSAYNSTRNRWAGDNILTHKTATLREIVLRAMRTSYSEKDKLHTCISHRLASLSPEDRDRV